MVVIATTTSGSTIRYTIDGSTPSETNGTVYGGPVTVASSLTLKAIAYQNGWNDSAVASATYSIGNFTVAVTSEPAPAVAVVSTDELVSEPVLAQLRDHPAVMFARAVEFRS